MRNCLLAVLAVFVVADCAMAADGRQTDGRTSWRKGDTVIVRVQNAPLQIESDVVSQLACGQTLQVERVSVARDATWLWTEACGVKGWVNSDHVERPASGCRTDAEEVVSRYPATEYSDPFGDTTTLYALPTYDAETHEAGVQNRNYNLPWIEYPNLD
jgi:hypothetical protein